MHVKSKKESKNSAYVTCYYELYMHNQESVIQPKSYSNNSSFCTRTTRGNI